MIAQVRPPKKRETSPSLVRARRLVAATLMAGRRADGRHAPAADRAARAVRVVVAGLLLAGAAYLAYHFGLFGSGRP